MGTTNLVVEMVIIGFQVLIWMALIVLTIFGYSWIELSSLKDWTSVIVIGLVAVAYTLGVVFDSFVGSLPFIKVRTSLNWLEGDDPDIQHRVSAYLLANNLEGYELMSKLSNQLSLIRSTSINLSLISICSLLFVAVQFGFLWKILMVIAIFTVILVFLALRTWKRSDDGFQNYVRYLDSSLGSIKSNLTRKEQRPESK